MTIRKGLDLFLRSQEVRNNSKKSIRNYKQFCGYFVDYVGKSYPVKNLSLHDVEDFYLFLKNKTLNQGHKYKKISDSSRLSSITVQSYMRHVRAFINFLYKNHFIDFDIIKEYKLPKAQRKVIEILSDDEIRKIYNYICSHCITTFSRNLSMIFLMLDCGLRASEVINLKSNDIFWDRKIIRVIGKGNKERLVPLSDLTLGCLNAYDSSCVLYHDCVDSSFFLSSSGNPITYNALRLLVDRIAEGTEIKRLHCHLFRHTFATKYLINGGDIASLKLILGHTGYQVTDMYLHLANQYTISKFVKFSPLENLEL